MIALYRLTRLSLLCPVEQYVYWQSHDVVFAQVSADHADALPELLIVRILSRTVITRNYGLQSLDELPQADELVEVTPSKIRMTKNTGGANSAKRSG